MLEHSCTPALMNYAAPDHPKRFWGNLASSSVPCVVVNTAWFIKGWKQLVCAAARSRGGGRQLAWKHLAASVWCSAAWAPSARVRSYLRIRKHWWSHVWLAGGDGGLREIHACGLICSSVDFPFSLFHPLSSYLLFFPSLLFQSSVQESVSRFPLSIYTAFVLAPFWFTALMMRLQRWCNAGLHSWMFEQKFHTLFQSCELPVQSRDWRSIFIK